MIRMLLWWPRVVVLRRTPVAVVARAMVVTMIKPPARRSNSISRTATAVLVTVWLVVIHPVSNSSAGLIVGPAAVASVGDTATHDRRAQGCHQHSDPAARCDMPARPDIPAD
jgi:hypothetical protein